MGVKRWIAGGLSTLCLTILLCGCSLEPKYKDYDVSGYLNALFQSTYKGEHEEFIAVTASSPEEALENNDLVAENGAVHFCNAFGILPTDDQMKRLEEVVREAYKQTRFTVKDEERTAGGYTVEVEISPLLTFQSLTGAYEKALTDLQNGDLEIGGKKQETPPDPAAEDGGESSPEPTGGVNVSGQGQGVFDENTLFVDEVIRLSQEALTRESEYGVPTKVIIDVRQDDDGKLYLDRTRLEEIDVTVLRFARG